MNANLVMVTSIVLVASGLVGNLSQGRKIHTRGKYSMREETVKRVEITHPCKPTRSGVRITFPGMTDDLLVSFIGYKEPRLMYVNRCKGLCSSEAIGRVACVATKRTWKKVNMQLKTQVVGQETKERFRELVLEEHEECACQCLTVSDSHCMRPDLFNNETCSCRCDEATYHYDKMQCESHQGRQWDPATCSCGLDQETRSELQSYSEHDNDRPSSSQDQSTYVRGVYGSRSSGFKPLYDPPVAPQNCHDCMTTCFMPQGSLAEAMSISGDYITRHSWSLLTLCLICILALVISTLFFWKKARNLREEANIIWGSDDASSHKSEPMRTMHPQQPSLTHQAYAEPKPPDDANFSDTHQGRRRSLQQPKSLEYAIADEEMDALKQPDTGVVSRCQKTKKSESNRTKSSSSSKQRSERRRRKMERELKVLQATHMAELGGGHHQERLKNILSMINLFLRI